MNFEPLDTENGEVYEFVNEVTGGHITKEFIPSIDAGVQEAMESGILAGFPVVGVKATVTDGQLTTTSIPRKWPSRSPAPWCFKEAAPEGEAGHSRADHGRRGLAPRKSTWATSWAI